MTYYSKEPKSVIAFDLCTFFHADLIQSEARILTVVIKWHHRANGLLQHWAQKCDHFWFIHILSYRFNPIRSQLETVLHIWLVNVCMKECELIKGGSTIGLLAVSKISNSIKQHFVVKVWLRSVEKCASSTIACKWQSISSLLRSLMIVLFYQVSCTCIYSTTNNMHKTTSCTAILHTCRHIKRYPIFSSENSFS